MDDLVRTDLERAEAFSRLMRESRSRKPDDRQVSVRTVSRAQPHPESKKPAHRLVERATVQEIHRTEGLRPKSKPPPMKPRKTNAASSIIELQKRIEELANALERTKAERPTRDATYKAGVANSRELEQLHGIAVESIRRFGKSAAVAGDAASSEVRSLVHRLATLAGKVGLQRPPSLPSPQLSLEPSDLGSPKRAIRELARKKLVAQRKAADHGDASSVSGEPAPSTVSETVETVPLVERSEKVTAQPPSLLASSKRECLMNIDKLSEMIIDSMLSETVAELNRLEEAEKRRDNGMIEVSPVPKNRPQNSTTFVIAEPMAEPEPLTTQVGAKVSEELKRHRVAREEWHRSLSRFKYGSDDLAELIERLSELLISEMVDDAASTLCSFSDEFIDSMIAAEFQPISAAPM